MLILGEGVSVVCPDTSVNNNISLPKIIFEFVNDSHLIAKQSMDENLKRKKP